jgi:hypothetical protein
MTDEAVQAAFNQAYDARMRNRPDVTEAILIRLVQERPNAARIRFDLGVAHAEQGNCAEASRSFARGAELAQTPTFARATQDAMADLCPRLAPFEASLNFALKYDSNINSGTSTNQIEVGGFPVTLSDDAVAQSSVGYAMSGEVAYNHKVSQTIYVVPSLSGSLQDVSGSDYDTLTLSPGVALRYRGDRFDGRFGPKLHYTFDTDSLSQKGWGFQGSASYTINARSGLYFDAGLLNVEDQNNALRDYALTTVGIRYIRALETQDMVLRLGLNWSDKDYEDDLQDISALTAEVGLSGSLTDQIGFDVSLNHTQADGSVQHPFFGVVRSDAITTISVNTSFARFESVLGRPYIGVSYSTSESSFDSKDYEKTSLNIGFTRRF